MSYIVLARKWRPQGFEDLIGQDTAVRTFRNSLTSGKIVHAFLFSGPRGVGKTSSARILAKALNCQQRAESEPCGTCPSCVAITDGASVDVIEIDGASNTSVDAVRELRETVKYAPSGGKYKIYIIDEVHMLSTPAFNALLKTLEEPPPHVVFVFATTEPKKIPATILSRCQHHAFRKISRVKIRERLTDIAEKEKITITDKALDMIARAADGSMRDALTLMDQALSFSDEIDDRDLQGLLGLPERDTITDLSEGILQGDSARTLSIIKELSDRGSDLRQLTKDLVEQFRNIAVAKVTDNAKGLLEFSPEEVRRLLDLASRATLEELTLLLSELLRLESDVRNAMHPRYTLELGLLRTSFVKGMTSIPALLKKMGKGKEEGAPEKTGPKKQVMPAQEKKRAGIKHDREAAAGPGPGGTELWEQLITELDLDNHLLACKLAEAQFVKTTESELVIGFNGGMSVLADSIKKSAPLIEPLLADLSGRQMKLKIQSMPMKSSKSDLNTIKERVFSEPIVQEAMKIFNGSMMHVRSLEGEGGPDQGD